MSKYSNNVIFNVKFNEFVLINNNFKKNVDIII